MLTQEYLKECLDYNPETGVFTWKERPIEHFKSELTCKRWNVRLGNKEAGSIHGSGYLIVAVNRIKHRAHRLAWFYMNGKFPGNQIDHIDNDKLNNRISNLRDVANQVNTQNVSKPRTTNKTGFIGVYKHKCGKYCAQIMVDGKGIYLGIFKTPQQAHAKYIEAKRKLHKGYIHD